MSFQGAHEGRAYWACRVRTGERRVETLFLYYNALERDWALGTKLGGADIVAGIDSDARTPERAPRGRWHLSDHTQARGGTHGQRTGLLRTLGLLGGKMVVDRTLDVVCDLQVRAMARVPAALRGAVPVHTARAQQLHVHT